jgi:hypothetical protein
MIVGSLFNCKLKFNKLLHKLKNSTSFDSNEELMHEEEWLPNKSKIVSVGKVK